MHEGLVWLVEHARSLAGARGRSVVVKVGGSIQDQPEVMKALMGEVAALALLGARVCVVHGGGKAISAAMAGAGLAPRFIAGQRHTDAATLRIAERVLALTVNAELAGFVAGAGATPIGLHSLGTCVLKARRTRAVKAEDDLGLVGEVVAVEAEVLAALMASGSVPVIAPVALDVAVEGDHAAEGPGKLNVNADLAAGAVAGALTPDAMVLVSDTPGVRGADGKYLAKVTRPELAALRESGVIDGGMLPKARACEMALDAGVRAVSIVDGRERGALLRAGLMLGVSGTMFVS